MYSASVIHMRPSPPPLFHVKHSVNISVLF
nr:MAG TPA: hypothetical protein [Caudoviricetes sp.]